MAEERNLTALIEAVLFAQGQPVDTDSLCRLTACDRVQVENALLTLMQRYEKAESGIQLMRTDDSWMLATKAEYAAYISQSLELNRQQPLSKPAMEVLSIIAYKQPISRSYIDSIRGVDSSRLLHLLLEKELIEEAGRLDVPGRPIIYRTTALFLRSFQLNSLADLPALPEEYEGIELTEADAAQMSFEEEME